MTLNSTLDARVEAYFKAVDHKDLDATLAFFAPDAVFTVATFNAVYRGRDTEVRGMFERLFARYEGIWHGNFKHIVDAPSGIATRFEVENLTATGERVHKQNANFFGVRDGVFSEVFVYMSGDNALR